MVLKNKDITHKGNNIAKNTYNANITCTSNASS